LSHPPKNPYIFSDFIFFRNSKIIWNLNYVKSHKIFWNFFCSVKFRNCFCKFVKSQNWSFSSNIEIFVKIKTFAKIKIVPKNWNFRQKIEIFVKKLKFLAKLKFSSKNWDFLENISNLFHFSCKFLRSEIWGLGYHAWCIPEKIRKDKCRKFHLVKYLITHLWWRK